MRQRGNGQDWQVAKWIPEVPECQSLDILRSVFSGSIKRLSLPCALSSHHQNLSKVTINGRSLPWLMKVPLCFRTILLLSQAAVSNQSWPQNEPFFMPNSSRAALQQHHLLQLAATIESSCCTSDKSQSSRTALCLQIPGSLILRIRSHREQHCWEKKMGFGLRWADAEFITCSFIPTSPVHLPAKRRDDHHLENHNLTNSQTSTQEPSVLGLDSNCIKKPSLVPNETS